jgi:hypothetical protein
MKVLLDECVPVAFRHHLPGHVVHTVEWAGFKGLKNGELLQRAAEEGYEVLITVDQGIPRGVNRETLRIAVVLVQSTTNQLEDLLPAADEVLRQVAGIRPGEIAVVSAGS